MRANHETLYGGCMMTYISAFNSRYEGDLDDAIFGTGCGWVCAGFIKDDADSDLMFKYLEKKYKLLYKTDVRTNRNSGNEVYFAIFDITNDTNKYGFDDAERDDDNEVVEW